MRRPSFRDFKFANNKFAKQNYRDLEMSPISYDNLQETYLLMTLHNYVFFRWKKMADYVLIYATILAPHQEKNISYSNSEQR